MFYCGDTDGAVPCLGARKWIEELDWTVDMQTTSWHSAGDFAGQITRYDGLDFVTVHGAGHMCPQWKRRPVTDMITSWIHNE